MELASLRDGYESGMGEMMNEEVPPFVAGERDLAAMIEEMVTRLVVSYTPEKVILFGSRAQPGAPGPPAGSRTLRHVVSHFLPADGPTAPCCPSPTGG